jgi:proline iminopeptidase
MTNPILHRVATSALGTYVAYVLHGLAHPSLLRPNADERDRIRPLPGDELVSDPHWSTTFATTIHAHAGDVWPWIVQLGYGRAGWYTWYRYDNGGVPSADIIVPELQDLHVGGVVPDGPRAREGFGVWSVRSMEPPRSLVLVSRRNPFDGREVLEGDPSVYIDCSWVFVLEEETPGWTRLVVRVRARLENIGHGALLARAMRLIFGVGDTVMERTLLEGIKARAERTAS